MNLTLEQAGSVAGILSFAVLVGTLGYAHHQAIGHLRAHIELLRSWACGHKGEGWSEDEVTPADRLTWMFPHWSIVPNFSGPAISQLTLLSNIAVHPDLTPYLVNTAQSVEAFNHAIARHESFKTSRPDLFLSVQEKLANGTVAVFGRPGPPPAGATQAQVNDALSAATLSGEELRYANTLGGILLTLHVQTIGHPSGKGMRRHVGELVREFERLHDSLSSG